MANDASIGRHTMQHVQRLERNLRRLSGGDFTMPDHNRYGAAFLLIDQLKAINVCLEGVLGGTVIEAESETISGTVSSEVPTYVGYWAVVESEPIATEPPVSKYADLTVKELKKLAAEHGGLMASLNTKTLLIEALEAADKAAEQANVNGEE